MASVSINNLSILLLSIPLILVVGLSRIIYFSRNTVIKVKRITKDTRLLVGETKKVRLLLINEDKRNHLLEVYDRVSNELLLNSKNRALVHIKPKETVMLEYEVKCITYGHYIIGPTYLMIRDPLNIYYNRKKIDNEIMLTVFPKFTSLKELKLMPKRTGIWPGSISSRKKGEGMEFYGLREYMPGDELKRINWKASAKRGILISNEYESERVTDVVIIVDVGGYEVIGNKIVEIVNREVFSAASFSYHLLKYGNRVGLIVHGRNRLWIKPEFGKKQFIKILHGLADVRPGVTIPIGYVVRLLTPFILKPGSQIIVLSPLLDESIVDALNELFRMKYFLLIISPEISINGDEATKIAISLINLKRENLIMQLRDKYPVIRWEADLPLDKIIKRIREARIAYLRKI